MGIVERFNRTLRGLLEADKMRFGKQPIKNLLPICLAKYNRHNNQRSVSDYFCRRKILQTQEVSETGSWVYETYEKPSTTLSSTHADAWIQTPVHGYEKETDQVCGCGVCE